MACLRADLDDLLTWFRYSAMAERKVVRTSNDPPPHLPALLAVLTRENRLATPSP